MILMLIGTLLAVCFLLIVVVGAPFVPSRPQDIEAIMKACHIKKGSNFVDLGCGDGRVLLAAARSGADVIGYEINPILALIAKIRLMRYNSRIMLAPYQAARLGDADYVYIFSAGPYMKALERQLRSNVRSGTTIISYGFKLRSLGAGTQVGGAYLYRFDGVRSSE